MNSPEISDCPAGCSQCSSAKQPIAPGEDVFIGWRLAVAALWVFVLPLTLALVASLVARTYWPGPTRMLVAALIGLAVGGVISSIALKLIRTTHTDVPVEPAYAGDEHH
ncbi:MAG: hypothetical protein QGH94_00875 [Phycisphaerae bacterium]|nr:hypothetical protein [Phycisphaerae bacterium]MDP7286522.1 hypothetical protein [Phycisphaerae bacterium]